MASQNSTILSPCSCIIPEAVKWTELCLEGVALPAIGTMGVLGNVVAVLVFRYRKMVGGDLFLFLSDIISTLGLPSMLC